MALTNAEKEKIKYGVRKSIAQTIVPSASTEYDLPFNIYVGTGGDVEIETTGGNTIILKNVPSGTFIDYVDAKKIGRNTTARHIVAIY